MFRVDLNCDMGESFGAYRIGNDDEIMQEVTSVNIACGFHAGDPAVMRKTVQSALNKGAAIGAHPGLPDLSGFGRRYMAISEQEAYDMVVYQIGALSAFVTSEGGAMHHVKPHGALYNMAAKDAGLARAIAEAVYRVNPGLILYGLAGSELIAAGNTAGLRTANEVFADRSYQRDGSLTPRDLAGSLIADEGEAVRQVLGMVRDGKVVSVQGDEVKIQADTVCIHGDAPGALRFARRIRESLTLSGVSVQAFRP